MSQHTPVLENPLTGERIIFHQTARQTQGALARFDHFMAPQAGKIMVHRHFFDEQYEIIAGEARYSINGVEQRARAGDVVFIPSGVVHTNPWNDGHAELHALREVRPDKGAVRFYETLFGLARDGKTDKLGQPDPFQTALIFGGYNTEIFMPVIPIAIQRWLFAALAAIGRRKGYRPWYPEYSLVSGQEPAAEGHV